MSVELITRYAKILILFLLIWGGILVWNTQGCRKVPGREMEPSIKGDKWVRINPRVRDPETDLSRNDVIFFDYNLPNRRQQRDYISRVVGRPGDRVRIVKGEVYVNGEKAQDTVQAVLRGAEDFEEIIVPRDCVFVLCDNRKVSRDFDSRTLGPIGKWAISGKIR